ncbi:hypothetical protein GOBAR_DD01410 [Gossypium barbadense]|nr:hypothetical protein GOBAR_DD01410 [Gossypium barbadense]
MSRVSTDKNDTDPLIPSRCFIHAAYFFCGGQRQNTRPSFRFMYCFRQLTITQPSKKFTTALAKNVIGSHRHTTSHLKNYDPSAHVETYILKLSYATALYVLFVRPSHDYPLCAYSSKVTPNPCQRLLLQTDHT